MPRYDEATISAFIESGRASPPKTLTLPAEKDGFPKVLCLDTKVWIALGQAHYGHPSGQGYEQALAAVREAVRQGRLVVPVFQTGMVEARSHTNPDRRKRLARFMVELSGNFSVRPFEALLSAEIRNAVRRQYLNPSYS